MASALISPVGQALGSTIFLGDGVDLFGDSAPAMNFDEASHRYFPRRLPAVPTVMIFIVGADDVSSARREDDVEASFDMPFMLSGIGAPLCGSSARLQWRHGGA